MSKRSEEQALKAYPDFDSVTPIRRACYQEGYEQAEKDMLEKVIVWMKENAKKYIVDSTPTYPDAEPDIYIGGKCWEHLKQAMEEE